MDEHGGLGAASGSLSYLAPVPSAFWHVCLSQLNFSEYFYQLFLFLPKNDFLSTKCPFCPSQVAGPVFPSPRPDLARSTFGTGALGRLVRLTSPYGCDLFLSCSASRDCGAQATLGQLGVNVTGSHAQLLGLSLAGQAPGGSPVGTGSSQRHFSGKSDEAAKT